MSKHGGTVMKNDDEVDDFFSLAKGEIISYDYSTLFFVGEGAPILFLSWALAPDSGRFPHKNINRKHVVTLFQRRTITSM